MSSILKWRPSAPPEGKNLSDEFRAALRSYCDRSPIDEIRLSVSDIPLILGMRAALDQRCRKECDDLIDGIRRHGEILLWEYFE